MIAPVLIACKPAHAFSIYVRVPSERPNPIIALPAFQLEWLGMRARLAVLVPVSILSLVLVVVYLRSTRPASKPGGSNASPTTSPAATATASQTEFAPTAVYAHNLMLRKGPDFRIYVRWLQRTDGPLPARRQSNLRRSRVFLA